MCDKRQRTLFPKHHPQTSLKAETSNRTSASVLRTSSHCNMLGAQTDSNTEENDNSRGKSCYGQSCRSYLLGTSPKWTREAEAIRRGKLEANKSSFRNINGLVSPQELRFGAKVPQVQRTSGVARWHCKERLWNYAAFTEQGASTWQMTLAKVMDVVARKDGRKSSLTRYILEVLSEQHKSIPELWWKNRKCSRSCSAQIQMSKPKRKSPKTSQLGASTWKVTLESVLNAFASWHTRRLTNFMKCPHCLDDHQIKPEDPEIVGELSEMCTQIVLKCLYLTRVGTPDLLWTFNCLAGSVTKWKRACDLRLGLLISYLHHTANYKQYCHVGNQAADYKLGHFPDADVSGNLTDSQPTSDCVMCMLGTRTFVPISWACKKQLS